MRHVRAPNRTAQRPGNLKKPVEIALQVIAVRPGRDVVRGVCRYAREQGIWHLFGTGVGAAGIWEPVDLTLQWRGDGIIAFVTKPGDVDKLLATGRPVVNVSSRRFDLPFAQVIPDNAAAGRAAAEHLLHRGYRSFAYCGFEGHGYSAERHAGFAQVIRDAGHPLAEYHADPGLEQDWTWQREQADLTRWLRSLPLPAAVAACTDVRARQISEAAQRIGMAVPDQLAIIGFDDDEMVCEMANPPLSSVQMNYEDVGYHAAALLDQLMRGQDAPDRPIRVTPGDVVTRASTDILAIDDPLVAAALRYIWQHAHRPIQAGEVVAHVPASRRVIERRFKQTVGRTLHEEIQRVHVQKARQLLVQTSLPAYEIATRAGFHDAKHLNRVFKQHTGITPLEHRRRIAKQTSAGSAAPTLQASDARDTGKVPASCD